MKKYTIDDVKKVTWYSSWWGRIVIYPFADRLLLLIANHTNLTPNKITLTSFLLIIMSSLCFLQASPLFMIIGSFLFLMIYPLDCVDGGLAKLKYKPTKLGAYIDPLVDFYGAPLVLSGLIFGQYTKTGDVLYLIFGFAYITIRGIKELSYLARKQIEEKKIEIQFNTGIKWRLKSLPSVIETDILIFFISPVVMVLFLVEDAVKNALLISFFVLLSVTIITTLSSIKRLMQLN